MKLIYNESSDFRIEELYLDSNRNIVTSVVAQVELRIFEYVPNANNKIYDWNDGTFKLGAPTTEQDNCTHRTAGGVNTGNWENQTAIDKDAFIVGSTYYFQFKDSDAGLIIGEYEIQWAGRYGNTIPFFGDAMALVTDALTSGAIDVTGLAEIVDGVLAGVIDVVDLKTALKEIKAAVVNKGTWNRSTGIYSERDDADGTDVNSGTITDAADVVTRTPD